MIRVRKPKSVPMVLRNEGLRARKALCAKKNIGEEFAFDKEIYGHRSVKQVLVSAQHGKCCYCEAKVNHVAAGDVEHYRPKAAVQQSEGESLQKPGYYWLAYEWDNLLFACSICNSQHKKNLFPLRDPKKRARSHRADLSREEPLLIHPAEEDPRRVLRFRDEYAYPVKGNERGQVTLNVLKLNERDALVEDRRKQIAIIRRLEDLVRCGDADARAEAEALLSEMESDSAEYASMVRAARARRA